MDEKNYSDKIKYFEKPKSPLQEKAINSQNYTKNSVVFRNEKPFIDNNKKNKEIISEDDLDHPKPLPSDFEGKEEIKKYLLLQELRENKSYSKIKKEKIQVQNKNNQFHKFGTKLNKKEIAKLTENNDKNSLNIVRVNLKEINNILFKNKLKKKIKEEIKNNNSEINQEKNLRIKVHNLFKQNLLKEKELNNINRLKIDLKPIISDESNEKPAPTSPELNKKIVIKPFINKIINKTNNNHQKINTKYALYWIKHKQKLSFNENDFQSNNPMNTNSLSTTNTSINLNNKKAIVNSDIIKNNNHSFVKPIYMAHNPIKKIVFYPKNKNCSNITTTDAESSKEKNNDDNNLRNKILSLYNSNERMSKQTYSKGGKYNNIQTTYIISTRKSTSKNAIKVNKNSNLKNINKIYYIKRYDNLYEVNNINNSYSNILNKTLTNSNKTINSSREKNIHIIRKNIETDSFNNSHNKTVINTNRIRSFLSEKRCDCGINKYNNKNDNKIKNIKYNNTTRRFNKVDLKYYNENTNYFNQDISKNTFDFNRDWNIQLLSNYETFDSISPTRYYNY